MKNKTWYYYGNGMDSFGDDNKWKNSEILEIKDDEILARVDACAICASDVKMIRMGNDYPLFKNRNFDENPAILGHELSLTIVEVGKNLQKDWKAGMRIGVQPDVYMDSIRYCIGVTVDGGMQKYMILHESVFHSDYGVTVFPVDEKLSFAEVSLLEPNACIEAAYRKFTRTEFDSSKTLLMYEASDPAHFEVDIDLNHKKKITVSNYEECHQAIQNTDAFEDVLILGNPDSESIKEIIDHLGVGSVFCWCTEENTDMMVDCDIAKIHYDKIHFTGTSTKRVSDAFKNDDTRYECTKGGKLLIVGGAGAMGRIHTLRALMDPNGPNSVAITARGLKRVNHLLTSFQSVADDTNKTLLGVATSQEGWDLKLREAAPEGFDDLVVCAPGIEPVDEGIPFIKKGGKAILFSGTKYGTYTKLPIGWIPSYGFKLNASSGSTVEDEKQVLSKIVAKILDPNRNVAAIAGFDSIKLALEAVAAGTYPGKVILYPQIDSLPLTGIDNLGSISQELEDYVAKNGWNRKAETILYKTYGKEES